MKLRSTTPVSMSLRARVTLVAFAVLVAVAAPIQIARTVSADKYDEQISAIKKQVDVYNAEAARLQGEADTLQNKLSEISADKSALQANINLNQLKYDQLVEQIATNEKKISTNKDVLGDTIADLYVDDKISPLEMLASSKNIGDYLDKQEYRSSVRDQLTATIAEIKALKKELEKQQAEVKAVLDEQNAQKEVLANKEAEQASLLEQTKGQEAAYQALNSQAQQQITSLQAQQKEAIAKITGGGKNTAGSVGSFQWRNYSGEISCGGGYPGSKSGTANGVYYQYGCNLAHSTAYIDEWRVYSRECVSYAAWAAQYRFGKSVGSFRGQGNAYQWTTTGIVESMGADVNNTPAVGAVAIKPRDSVFTVGHAMVVEDILGDGWVKVSQYNFAVDGRYSTMEIPANSVNYVHFK